MSDKSDSSVSRPVAGMTDGGTVPSGGGGGSSGGVGLSDVGT